MREGNPSISLTDRCLPPQPKESPPKICTRPYGCEREPRQPPEAAASREHREPDALPRERKEEKVRYRKRTSPERETDCFSFFPSVSLFSLSPVLSCSLSLSLTGAPFPLSSLFFLSLLYRISSLLLLSLNLTSAASTKLYECQSIWAAWKR
jgi:hypothetical protein